jgi:hypothetical protein
MDVIRTRSIPGQSHSKRSPFAGVFLLFVQLRVWEFAFWGNSVSRRAQRGRAELWLIRSNGKDDAAAPFFLLI